MDSSAAHEFDELRAFWTDRNGSISASIHKAAFGHLHGGRGQAINLRHFHNRFGWQANRASPCEGAFYRSERFMALTRCDRRGSKLGQTVHIEHTVPVATLMAHFCPAAAHEPLRTMAWLLAHSITTAVRDGPGEERHTMVHPGQHKRSHALTVGHEDFDRPFRRYDRRRHSPLWDVVRGQPIDPETFSFADHAANLATVLGWANRGDWVEAVSAVRR